MPIQVALQHDGGVIGVIGTGLDRYYPAENQALQFQVAKRILLTEYPLAVTPALPLPRNGTNHCGAMYSLLGCDGAN